MTRLLKIDDTIIEEMEDSRSYGNRSSTDLKKKDWIEQTIVLAPTKLQAGSSCWDHFRGKAYCMPWVK